MWSKLLVLSMLVMGSFGACNTYDFGGNAEYPLDYCTNVASSGTTTSYKFVCNSGKTDVESTVYTQSGCKGTSFSGGSISATGFECDEGKCSSDDVARVRTYESTDCKESDTYATEFIIINQCIAITSTTSSKWTCADGVLSITSYNTDNTCTTASSTTALYTNDECDSVSSVYYTVACKASADSNAFIIHSFSLFSLFVIIVVHLF